MSNVTLEAIEGLLDGKLSPINTKLQSIEEVLTQHTAALEVLLTEKKNRDDAKVVKDDRLDYLEKWAKQVSQKFGIEFRP
ncbi:MAG: hypothetical protein P4L79_07785 [Legionella sp.]|uniref:hypothetical protein n=1 Tax=Legionella sp. TaxID=459 RepID=UPI0028478BF3|nr:hypothetical protein [Legionella sp.]